MATHYSILAQRIPWTEEPSGLYSPWGCKELDTTEHAHTHTKCHKENTTFILENLLGIFITYMTKLFIYSCRI